MCMSGASDLDWLSGVRYLYWLFWSHCWLGCYLRQTRDTLSCEISCLRDEQGACMKQRRIIAVSTAALA